MIYWSTCSDASIRPKEGGKDIFHNRRAGCFDRCARYPLKPFDGRLEEQCCLPTQPGNVMRLWAEALYLHSLFNVLWIYLSAL